MADFLPAYQKTIVAEGGLKLTNISGDAGGQTYAGISRHANPQWEGWELVDKGITPPERLVQVFYKSFYWDCIMGDKLDNQDTAENLFDFAVNGGVDTAKHLAQHAAKVTPDRIFGSKTIIAINSMDQELFQLRFDIYKIDRYRDIVTAKPVNAKFLLGWINRTLNQEGIS